MAPYRTSGCPYGPRRSWRSAPLTPATREAVRLALGDPADPVRCAAVRVLHGGKDTDALLEALPQLAGTEGQALELARRALASLRG